jgi:protein angel
MIYILQELSIKFVYKSRTGDKIDGLAVCYDSERFELVDKKYIEFAIDEEHRILCKNNICLIPILRERKPTPITSNKIYIVATIHILFNMKRGDIKLAQINLALKALEKLSLIYKDKEQIILFCGDFNTIPNSGIYQFISKGYFDFLSCVSQEVANSHGLSFNLTYILYSSVVRIRHLIIK